MMRMRGLRDVWVRLKSMSNRAFTGVKAPGSSQRPDCQRSGTQPQEEPVDGNLFHLVDLLVAAVTTLSGIAFSIFVGQHRALCAQDIDADDIFRRDQFDLCLLPVKLVCDSIGGGGGGVRDASGTQCF